MISQINLRSMHSIHFGNRLNNEINLKYKNLKNSFTYLRKMERHNYRIDKRELVRIEYEYQI